MHSGFQRRTSPLIPAACAAVGMVLLAAPILAIAIRGLLVWHGAWPRLSLVNFGALVLDSRFAGAVFNTIVAGVCTTALSLTGGVTLAFLVARTDMPGRGVLGRMNLLPFFLSPYAAAMAWLWLLAPHDGILTTWTRAAFDMPLEWLDIYSVPGVIFVLTLCHIPYAYLLAIPPLRDMDAAFEDTARVHGATFWYTMRHITLPMLLPALSAAALIVFVASAGLIDVPLALGLSRGIYFVPTEIYAMSQRSSDFGVAAAFSVVAILGGAGLTIWYRRTMRRWGVSATVEPAYRPRPIHLTWPVRLTAWALEAVYLSMGALLPLAVLLMVSLTRIWNGRFVWRAATLVNYDAILWHNDTTRAAIGNSMTVAVCGATIGVGLAATLAVYLRFNGSRHSRTARAVLRAAGGIPAICFGLGFLVLTWRTPLYGTLGLVIIACVARFLPFATRHLTGQLEAIDSGQEQMARIAGASRGQWLRHIVLPLVRPSMIAAWLLLFVVFIRELGATIMVYGQGSETIAVAMAMQGDGSPGRAAALAVVQSVVLMAGFLAYNLTRAPLGLRPA
jgi:iron(III) transport system permease protein